MDKAKVAAKLNEAITLELTGLLQYNQYSMTLLGPDRRIWEDFFKDSAFESLDHARMFASKVVSLGGVPAVEPDAVHQCTDVKEMLEISLAHERRAVDVYTEALKLCEGNAALCNLLEDQIQQETEDYEEIEKFLNKVPKISASTGSKKASKSA